MEDQDETYTIIFVYKEQQRLYEEELDDYIDKKTEEEKKELDLEFYMFADSN